ncbi:MAG: LuxR C-terminal-related transcriptional regulator [Alphaproteobacteria bacterium]
MRLSEREVMVAERYAAGETYKQIASSLNIAPSTVRNHLAAVYRKLEVRNKPGLIRELSARKSDFGILPPLRGRVRTASVLRNLEKTGPPAIDGASIAIMPFATIGPADRDYVGHGFAADIQHNLTRCDDLFVSGRSSCGALSGQGSDPSSVANTLGVQYVLQGSLRTDHDKIRLIAELVDGSSGMVLWSERYDRVLNDILDIEAQVANAVAANLSLQIKEVQYERRRHLGDSELTAYDWRLRGNRCLELGGRPNLDKARDSFRRALELEPESAPSYAGLSMCFGYECDLLLAEDYAESLKRHTELALLAVAANEADSRGHYALTCALMLDGQYERADFHAARGMELNPSEYHNLCNRGYSLMALGRIEESVACFTDSLRRNPLAPNSCLLAVGLIEYLEANYGQSAGALSRMTGYQVQRASTLAAACAQAEYEDAAHSAVQEFRRLRKDRPILPTAKVPSAWRDFWRRVYPYLRDEDFERLLEGIGKAALPV